MSAAKQRWPRADALRVAEELVAKLEPHCSHILICGSLRRLKPDVGDIEIVYVPRMMTVMPKADVPALDFFMPSQPQSVDLAAVQIAEMLALRELEKRLSVTEREAWGAKNKLARHVASGIPVDLFSTTEASWPNYIVCRTGGAQSNTDIAYRAKTMGWQWHPYGEGFTRSSGGDKGKLHRVTRERDVFDFVRMPYLEPEARP